MKKAVLLVLAGMLLAGGLLAKDMKIGYIISARILDEYPEAQDAQKILSDEIAEWQRQGQQMQTELEALGQELDQQAMMFYSEEKKAEKAAEYQKKLDEFRNFQSGIEQRAMQRNQELFNPINEKIQKVIDTIAADEGYDIIFDAVGTNIAYADQRLDITDLVLEQLQKASGGASAGSGGSAGNR